MSTSNNLSPELTARIEDLKKRYSSPYYLRNHTEAGIIEMACRGLAEPLHKEIEELRAQLADTEASRQEYIRLFHEQERENDALEKKYSAVSSAYNELIMAVGRKFPGEIRHDTALRYIKRAEELSDAGPARQPNQEPS